MVLPYAVDAGIFGGRSSVGAVAVGILGLDASAPPANASVAGIPAPRSDATAENAPTSSATVYLSPEQMQTFVAAMSLIKERAVFLSEIPAKIAYLFSEPLLPAEEEFFPKKMDRSQTIGLLEKGREMIAPMASMNDADAEAFIKEQAEKASIKLGDLMMPLRVAITGARVSPPLFGSLRLLGGKRSLERVERAIALLRG
jgi:glutamyl-tRNA synthetase